MVRVLSGLWQEAPNAGCSLQRQIVFETTPNDLLIVVRCRA